MLYCVTEGREIREAQGLNQETGKSRIPARAGRGKPHGVQESRYSSGRSPKAQGNQ